MFWVSMILWVFPITRPSGDLLTLCVPDAPLIATAFVFLLLAAMAQIYIPRFTGNILDALTSAYAGENDDGKRESIWDVPGFVSNVE